MKIERQIGTREFFSRPHLLIFLGSDSGENYAIRDLFRIETSVKPPYNPRELSNLTEFEIGASPSGKATGFDPVIPRFES
jgi:hypothetical protein